jgi:RNA-directed DNA polymerase
MAAAANQASTDVVDADLSKYFDTIPHHELLQSVARRVVDGAVLRLVKMWLRVSVDERDAQGRRRMTGGKGSTHGTPQGGVISPLLANIYMHRFLRAWRQRGKGREYRARLITYADDFVIVSRGQAAAALTWTRAVMGRIGLTLNDAKTSIRNARAESFDFLGYTCGPDRSRKNGRRYLAATPSRKSVQRVKAAVSAVLHPGNHQRWPDVSADLNRRLRGWAAYFSYGTRVLAYRAIDHYVSDAVCHFLRRRHRVPTRGTRRFGAGRAFGPLGVLRLESLTGRSPACV